MHGVSEVIAIILILMITISLAGLAYMFMSTTMSDVTSSAGSTVDTTTTSMLTSFKIESIDIAKVYVRNTGQNALTSLSVYVNDEPAIYNVTTPIAAGSVGTITIYSFIPDGATIKVTSPNGFSASKVAQPCDKAIGCWKFEETSGTAAYDSSSYGHTGTLVNGPVWVSGKYGNGIQFDGTNDRIFISKTDLLQPTTGITLSLWFKVNNDMLVQKLVSKTESGGYHFSFNENGVCPLNTLCWLVNIGGYKSTAIPSSSVMNNTWYYLVGTYNGSALVMYLNGVLQNYTAASGGITYNTGYANATPVCIGGEPGNTDCVGDWFGGMIDEVRIYNRAIY